MIRPAIGTNLVSRYPDLRLLAAAVVKDPAPPRSLNWPSLTERILVVLNATSDPMTITEVAGRLGTTSQNINNWFRYHAERNGVECVGSTKRQAQAKASKLWWLKARKRAVA